MPASIISSGLPRTTRSKSVSFARKLTSVMFISPGGYNVAPSPVTTSDSAAVDRTAVEPADVPNSHSAPTAQPSPSIDITTVDASSPQPPFNSHARYSTGVRRRAWSADDTRRRVLQRQFHAPVPFTSPSDRVSSSGNGNVAANVEDINPSDAAAPLNPTARLPYTYTGPITGLAGGAASAGQAFLVDIASHAQPSRSEAGHSAFSTLSNCDTEGPIPTLAHQSPTPDDKNRAYIQRVFSMKLPQPDTTSHSSLASSPHSRPPISSTTRLDPADPMPPNQTPEEMGRPPLPFSSYSSQLLRRSLSPSSHSRPSASNVVAHLSPVGSTTSAASVFDQAPSSSPQQQQSTALYHLPLSSSPRTSSPSRIRTVHRPRSVHQLTESSVTSPLQRRLDINRTSDCHITPDSHTTASLPAAYNSPSPMSLRSASLPSPVHANFSRDSVSDHTASALGHSMQSHVGMLHSPHMPVSEPDRVNSPQVFTVQPDSSPESFHSGGPSVTVPSQVSHAPSAWVETVHSPLIRHPSPHVHHLSVQPVSPRTISTAPPLSSTHIGADGHTHPPHLPTADIAALFRRRQGLLAERNMQSGRANHGNGSDYVSSHVAPAPRQPVVSSAAPLHVLAPSHLSTPSSLPIPAAHWTVKQSQHATVHTQSHVMGKGQQPPMTVDAGTNTDDKRDAATSPIPSPPRVYVDVSPIPTATSTHTSPAGE